VLETEKRKELQVTWLYAAEVQLSLAHRTVSGAPGWTTVKRPLSGKVQRHTAIIHRTVRWCTGLSGGAPDCPVNQRSPAQRSAAQSAGDTWPAPTVGKGHRTVRCANWPMLQRSSTPEKERDRHRTVRCATRQKARMAFLVGLQRLLAALGYKRDP
jgi:hypothetical protein